MGDDMTLCQCIRSLASQMTILVTALAAWAFTIRTSPGDKNKLT